MKKSQGGNVDFEQIQGEVKEEIFKMAENKICK